MIYKLSKRHAEKKILLIIPKNGLLGITIGIIGGAAILKVGVIQCD